MSGHRTDAHLHDGGAPQAASGDGTTPPSTQAASTVEPEADPFALPVGMEQYQVDMERGLDLFMDLAEVCERWWWWRWLGSRLWVVWCSCGVGVEVSGWGAIADARQAAWGELLWVIVPFAAHVHH